MYTQCIGEFLFGDLVPLSVADSKHFRAMMTNLSGGTYNSPAKKYFTETLLPKLWRETKNK